MKFWKFGIQSNVREVVEKHFTLVNLIASFGLIASMMAAIQYLLPEQLDLLSLHYNIYTGIDRIGPRAEIWLHPAIGCLFFLLNLYFAHRFLKKGDAFMNRLVIGFNTGILSVLAIATFTIVTLNR